MSHVLPSEGTLVLSLVHIFSTSKDGKMSQLWRKEDHINIQHSAQLRFEPQDYRCALQRVLLRWASEAVN